MDFPKPGDRFAVDESRAPPRDKQQTQLQSREGPVAVLVRCAVRRAIVAMVSDGRHRRLLDCRRSPGKPCAAGSLALFGIGLPSRRNLPYTGMCNWCSGGAAWSPGWTSALHRRRLADSPLRKLDWLWC